MNKNLERLKEHNQDNFFHYLGLQNFVYNYIIPILEDFDKRLKTIEAELGIFTDEEIKEIKIGGTD